MFTEPVFVAFFFGKLFKSHIIGVGWKFKRFFKGIEMSRCNVADLLSNKQTLCGVLFCLCSLAPGLAVQ